MERIDLAKSVHNVPTYEEFFGLDDNLIEDYEFEPANDDDDIRKMLIIMLALLQEFYIEHMYDEAYYFASEQFEDDIKEFSGNLKDNLLVLFMNYAEELSVIQNLEWKIPHGIVSHNIDVEDLVNSGVDLVTMLLFFELKDKADYYTLLSETTGTFSPHSNFRRAIRRLSNQVDFKGNHIKKVVNRKYQEFVYGQEALFRWRCSGINTCAWCYEIEAMGAMPLSWFPVDHVNGRCVLVPENPDEYSKEYLEVRMDG